MLPSRAGHPALLAETGPPPHPAPWHPSLGACSGVAAHAYPRRRVVRAGEVVEWRGQRARVRPRDADVAELVPLPGSPPLSAAFVRRCADTLVGRGFREIVTGALAPQEAHGFVDAGFERREHLCLLVHDLGVLAAVDDAHVELIRKPRRTERPAVLAVDALAFQPFWRIDDRGLDDAAAATPVSRFRVAGPPPRAGSVAGAPSEGRRAELAAYAISGRAGRRGYVQRLAVHPHHQRAGIGRALVLDGLHWMRRRRVELALVNTQVDNAPALGLYESLGFRPDSHGLDVFALRLQPPAPAAATGLL
ncbi:MAG: GNAT family N-acetyltransferase [Actinobacteria bacterium]|nr:MAG: GNAT family N-acetyltransferase [Actinomycetota bacterium]